MNCPLCKEQALILKRKNANDKLQVTSYCSDCEAFIDVTYPDDYLPTQLEGSD